MLREDGRGHAQQHLGRRPLSACRRGAGGRKRQTSSAHRSRPPPPSASTLTAGREIRPALARRRIASVSSLVGESGGKHRRGIGRPDGSGVAEVGTQRLAGVGDVWPGWGEAGARACSTPARDPKRLYTVIRETPARRAIATTPAEASPPSVRSSRAASTIERAVRWTAGWRRPSRYARVIQINLTCCMYN